MQKYIMLKSINVYWFHLDCFGSETFRGDFQVT